jgi:hypothetical protein
VAIGGALAGAATPAGSGRLWSVPTIPVRPVMDLVPALFLFYGGMIILVRSWLLLRRHHMTHGLAVGAFAAVVMVWSLPLLIGPPLGSRDVYAYAAQGRAADQGYDVYEDGPSQLSDDDPVLAAVDPLYREAPVVYGPVFVFVSATIAAVTGDEVVVAVLAYRLMSVLGLAVAAVAVHDLARGFGRDPADALVLAIANPLVLLHLVSGAHNEAIMLAFLLSGVAIARRPRLLHLGIGLCAMAAAIKLPAILAVAFLGWPWVLEARTLGARAGRFAVAAGEAFLVIALAGRLTGWGWGWVDALTSADPVEAYLSVTNMAGGGVALATGFDLAEVLAIARLSGLVLAATLTLLLLLRGYRSWPVALAWSLLIFAVLHPTTQPWYLTWGIMLLAASSGGERNRSLVTGCAVAAFVVLPVGPQLGWLILADTGIGSLVLALALLAVLTFSPKPNQAALFRTGLDRTIVSVVVPTRHERPNVGPLLASIEQAMVGRAVEVVFVDDSDDDTPAVIEAMAERSALKVRCVHRRPEDRWGGLAGAVVDGFGVASGSIAVVMDADLQHPADVLPQLIARIERGHNLAVASRRVSGGSESDGLTAARRLGSLTASSLAWALFPSRLRRVADPLSGFFALRLGLVDLDRLQPDGFKILVELLATHPYLSVAEIPYRFGGRHQGLSKASPSQATRYVGHLVDLRIRTSRAWAGAPVPQRAFRSA